MVTCGIVGRGEGDAADDEGEHSSLQTVLTMMATETSPPMALLGWASCLRRDTKLLASPARMLGKHRMSMNLAWLERRTTATQSGDMSAPESANRALEDAVCSDT